MVRKDMENELVSRFVNRQNIDRDNYKKKLKGLVDCEIMEEYNLIVKGIQPKQVKQTWKNKEDK